MGIPVSLLSSEYGDLDNPECPIAPVAVDLPGEQTGQWHHHQRLQLLYAVSGVMQVATPSRNFIVGAQHAMWIPPLVEHRVSHQLTVALRTLYVDNSALKGCSAECYVVKVSEYLRQLILQAIEAGANYQKDTAEWRLMLVILDELRALQPEPMNLPYPRDPRLLGVAEKLLSNPGDSRSLAKWAESSGASERTLARLFRDQTGMTFGKWRERLRLLTAITQLVKGEKVGAVAFDLGYKNSSDFIAMFHKNTDKTPAQYVKAHEDCVTE